MSLGEAMGFFRRLAPVRQGDSSRAVALTPSRFEAESPVRATPDRETSLEHLSPHASMPQASIDDDARSGAENLLAHPAREQGSRDVPYKPATHDVDVHAPDVAIAPPPMIDHENPRGRQHGAGRGLAQAANAVTITPRNADVNHQSPASHVATPLSDHVLARRIVPTQDARPAIHVTIDRIDVQAPAAQPRPKTRPRGQVAQTGTSLSDYLRRGRQGSAQ